MDTASLESSLAALLDCKKVRRALEFIRNDHASTLAELKEMVLVSGAPHTEQDLRSPMFLGKLRQYGLEGCHMDEVGNVFGSVSGSAAGKILAEAHLDTVFGPEVPLSVTEDDDGTLRCPGIADNTASMAAELSLVRAIKSSGLAPVKTLLIGGTVGEEAPGGARGVIHLMRTMKDLDAYVCLDSGHDFDIITGAVSCERHEITFSGPSGHSWNDWGRANTISALGRAISLISGITPPSKPKTTFNLGIVTGGTAVNTIPAQASMHVDVRSLDDTERVKLEEKLLDCVRKAAEEENAAHPGAVPITIHDRPYGGIPGGFTPDTAPIVKAALAAAHAIKLPRSICPPGCTNANFPISAGIPALCVNSNGKCGGIHSLDEWYDPTDSWKGVQALLLLLLLLAGLDGVIDPIRTAYTAAV
ncbi:MAG: M20/M25/M40 family metallo-hydrolase [Mailhella sp.]|nr:M20/M25/M40 family metallo-hydrolase [Mailhella sp.]